MRKLFSAFFLITLLFAGETQVSGHLVDSESGDPVIGASIYLRDGSRGGVSDTLGYFSLKFNDHIANPVIVIQHIAYQKQSIPYKNKESFPGKIFLIPAVLPYSEKVQVTAGRSAVSLKFTPAAADVIAMDEAAMAGPSVLSRVLLMSPSLGIRDYGGLAAMKSITLRGATAGQVLILLNGQRLNSPQNGEVDLALINPEAVERIEILRGGQSARYGADAVGGVVNIITRDADIEQQKNFSISFESGMGSYGTRSVGGHLDFSHRHFSVSFSGALLSSEGNFPYTDNWNVSHTRENNDSRSRQLHTVLKYSGKTSLHRLQYLFDDSERGVPGTLEPAYLTARQEDARHSLQYSAKAEKKHHSLSLDVSYMQTYNRYVNNEMLVPLDNRYVTQSTALNIQDKIMFSENISVSPGAGLHHDRQETLHQDTLYSRFSPYAYLLGDGKIPLKGSKYVIFQPALRFDAHSDYGTALSPQLGFLFFADKDEKLSFRGSAGKNYRAPTFNDLYWPQDAFAVGNPDLQPETGRDWELGARYESGTGLYSEITCFHRKVDNMIIWLDHAGNWWPENLDAAVIQGAEAVYRQQIGASWQLQMNYTFMHSVNLSHSESEYGYELPYRPAHTLNAGLAWNGQRVLLKADIKAVGKQYTDSHNTSLYALDPYVLTNISLEIPFAFLQTKGSLGAHVDNLFDINYRTLKNVPMPGRTWGAYFKIRL